VEQASATLQLTTITIITQWSLNGYCYLEGATLGLEIFNGTFKN